MFEPQPDHQIHHGVQCPSADAWTPFEWTEPKTGKQIHGEVTVAREFGSSGTLCSGFWRTGPNSPGCRADGSNIAVYSAPLGDETACVIDGTATLTVLATGKKHRVGPGSIITSPKHLEVEWDIDAPFFKKFWCIWNGSSPQSDTAVFELQINHTSDNPEEWLEYRFHEPKEGSLVAGELFFIRNRGSTDRMVTGIWRSGKGIPGSDVDEKGNMTTPYTGVLGDETIFLLEGEVEVTETDSGKKHSFKAGDAIGLTSGMHITWVSKGPFTKKLWMITRDEIAN